MTNSVNSTAYDERMDKECKPVLLWNRKVPDTELEKFQKTVEQKYNLKFASYWDFHRWSVTNFETFWKEIWSFYGFISSKPYDKVFQKTGPRFVDNNWFPGLSFNFAENLMRVRDQTDALICLDGDGHYEKVTFAEMFEEVKLYAAAFRKHGLQKGDMVACCMSNRKEAVFAMLATSSIGALWGGPNPRFCAEVAANAIAVLEPKFLITVDEFEDELTGENHCFIDRLPVFAETATTLEKIIVVPTRQQTLLFDFSDIPKSCLLGPFLESGKTRDGTVPELLFEQLPFDHPVFVSFTSGTTGNVKGIIHSAGGFLTAAAQEFSLNWNLKHGDIFYLTIPMGWSAWNYFVANLALGVTVFLYSGNEYGLKGGPNKWDLLLEHKISIAPMLPVDADKMFSMNLKPRENSLFEHLKVIFFVGCPAKVQHFIFVRDIVKENVFIGNFYGSTEALFSGVNLNLPYYAPEVQVPALGRDLQCLDSQGRVVIGQRGEMVLACPLPVIPKHLWKDEDGEIMNSTYLTKYPGVWHAGDECYINPVTKGMLVLGRSDDVLIQNGDRFIPSDVYFAIHDMEEIRDYICVGQKKANGMSRAVLFIQMKEGFVFTPQFQEKVSRKIAEVLMEDWVPELILEVKEIPYNLNAKRMESVIRILLETNKVPKVRNIKNVKCLDDYCNIPEIMSYYKE